MNNIYLLPNCFFTKKAGTTYIINVWFLLMSGCCFSVVVVFLF